MAHESKIHWVPAEPYARLDPADPGYTKAVVDYCTKQFLVADLQVMQVYEEFLNLAYWLRGFAPVNVMEIGAAGATFFLLSRFATGKKAAIDIRDIRLKLHNFMFGHDWCFFHGDSRSTKTRQEVAAFCDRYDVIFIDGDHRYEAVKQDFETYRPLLSERGVILFHDVDPDHAFKGGAGGNVWKFWQDLDEGTKTTLVCTRASGRIEFREHTSHFGGIGIWSPT